MSRAARHQPGALDLGAHVIEMLIPQRAPMLMVDRVDALVTAGHPTLHASRYITANEIFFQGHFPELRIWPGCLTIEGMGQAASLLLAIETVRTLMATPDDPGAGLEALRNVERGFRLHPGHDAEAAAHFRAELARHPRASIAVGASVDVKLLRPVFPGQRLEYRVALVLSSGALARFDVEALVNDATVAQGVMTGARVPLAQAPAATGAS